jgi:hypothetical protein
LSRLSDITFDNNTIPVELPGMPETLTHFIIKNCVTTGDYLLKISNLPRSLLKLDLEKTLIKELPKLPPNLRQLIISHATNTVELTSLPETLKH